MKPGRELDAFIAEKVMAWVRYGDSWATEKSLNARIRRIKSWRPSTDISDAWEVMEKFRFWGPQIWWNCGAQKYEVEFCKGPLQELTDFAVSDTAPHAICLAGRRGASVGLDNN